MDEKDWLAERFEGERGHLRAVAYRMLGSLSDAEDAVQESWLRLSRNGADEIDNLAGWLTTVVARVCLDMLRSRQSRREDPLEHPAAEEPAAARGPGVDPEAEAQMADSVGLALLVVLDRLSPAERLAFVLHDLFDVAFEEIASITGRSPEAARQLASRARRRVQGVKTPPATGLAEQRSLVERFLTALRLGDPAAVVTLLAPDFTVRADAAATPPNMPTDLHGAEAWAKEAVKAARGARFARPALLDGMVGVVVAPRGRLFRVLRFTFAEGKIAELQVVGERASLQALDVAILSD
ncbi:MAG TPA: sigma-70 family RNA polymerase sigma factor [Acidobacteriaceae bacterium]|jgi:RNA polymerase sigma-70 factor (ECF subfamily)|nr:sigma-70 family RNA polymerase sigma factor [Acidobacteriaceae bacterium]